MKILLHIRLFLIKITHYEYWPFWLFYLPMYFYGIKLAVRARSLTYFTAANPVMKYGGAFGMSKFDVLQKIDREFVPRGILIGGEMEEDKLLEEMAGEGLEFPLVAKPNIGERGRDVELIKNLEELRQYLQDRTGDIILQEYITMPMELGILYYRLPDGSKEDITSIVIRDFLKVQGDGQKNLQDLIGEKIRALFRRKYLNRKFRDRLQEIPGKGEVILLEPIGNHNRGTKFLNGNHLINQKLLEVISGIADSIEGFDYGRFDLKAENLETLSGGSGFKIIELNGTNSEPAHIYDPEYRLLTAYRDIARHMRIILRISQLNHIDGQPYASFRTFVLDLKKHLSR